MRIKARESDVQKAIMDYLAAEHIFAIRINTANIRIGKRFLRAHSAGPGLADILAFPTRLQRYDCDCLHGDIQPLWIEVKSPKGKQSSYQKEFQQLVEKNGHKYLIARSAEDLQKALAELGRQG